MWAVIQKQQKLIDQLQTELAESKVEQLEVQQAVESVADAVEEGAATGSALGDVSIGGYGELHYEGGPKDEIDFHRFVLFFGHEFTDDIRFFSELEIEHALAGGRQAG